MNVSVPVHLELQGLSTTQGHIKVWFVRGLTPQQQPASYRDGAVVVMMMMKSSLLEETRVPGGTDLQQLRKQTETKAVVYVHIPGWPQNVPYFCIQFLMISAQHKNDMHLTQLVSIERSLMSTEKFRI